MIRPNEVMIYHTKIFCPSGAKRWCHHGYEQHAHQHHVFYKELDVLCCTVCKQVSRRLILYQIRLNCAKHVGLQTAWPHDCIHTYACLNRDLNTYTPPNHWGFNVQVYQSLTGTIQAQKDEKKKTMTVCEVITFIYQFIYSFHKSWFKRVSQIIF